MSERIIHKNKPLTITIDGKKCNGVYGESILQIARRHDIYIPTMCYLTKVTPIASCRLCSVEVEGVDGFVLSCQEKAVDGAVIHTYSDELFRFRQNLIKLYDVNHPLQCGVCDKSGECELQNKNLEFKIDSQEFSAKEQIRKQKQWGILGYDPYLCILCEKCVHTCNEVIGSSALYIKPGGYKSTIDNKMSRCEQCGDCISVCPVGALTSNAYKYSANAWEGNKIPASCSHCSSGCALYYEVKHAGIDNVGKQKIVRVTNDFEFGYLCGAGRFGFSFENTNIKQDINEAIEAFKKVNTIKFNSYITNEEAFILQKLKEKLGIKLVNEDAKAYQQFINTYGTISTNLLYSGDSNIIKESDYIILIGSRIARDNPGIKYAINMAVKQNKAEFIYMHPIDDISLHTKYTQFVKYEVGSEEAVLAMILYYLLKDKNIPQNIQDYINDIDIGYISGESSVGEEEIELMLKKLIRKQQATLIIGADIYKHKRAKNIAKMVALIEKYAGFKIVLIPTQTNTLGVSLICDLDQDEEGFVIGYNEKGDYTIASYDEPDFNIPALNQQEGTFVSLDKKVINTNVAIKFDGLCLFDIANYFLNELKDYTIEFTKELPQNKGFKAIEFDELKNGYDKYGNDLRGYKLNDIKTNHINIQDIELEEVEELDSFNGSVIYRCEPLHQFNKWTSKSLLLQSDTHLRGSEQFAKAAKIKAGDMVEISYNGFKVIRKFKVDTTIKGTIALYPTFDNGLGADLIDSGYRYKKVKIKKVETK